MQMLTKTCRKSESSLSSSYENAVSVTSGVRRKFSWGVWFKVIWWLFVFGVRCLWRHNLTSFPCFQTNVWAKFV